MAVMLPLQKPPYSADEIDIFKMWDIVLAKRLIVFGISLLSSLGGFLYATLPLGTADQYSVVVFLEIGRYISQNNGIQPLESPNDLAFVLNQQNLGARASVPRGSASVLSIEAEHVDSVVARQRVDSALAFVIKRHESLAKQLPERMLTRSGIVAQPIQMLKSIKSKRAQVSAISAICGLLIGIFVAIFANAVQQRKASKPNC